MATNCVRHISLEINCGFARTEIRELTPKNEQVDQQQRGRKFKELYDGCSGFGFGAIYFDDKGKNGSMSETAPKSLRHLTKNGILRKQDNNIGKHFHYLTGRHSRQTKKSYTVYPSALHATSNSMTYEWHFLKDHTAQKQFCQ